VLSQEGIIVNSFLNAYFNRIANFKITVVNESNNPFSFEWFFLLKDLINDTIASIEITLALVHIKMRQTLRLKLSVNLINLTLFPPVLFVPEDQYSKRANPDFINQGYNTSRWEPRIT